MKASKQSKLKFTFALAILICLSSSCSFYRVVPDNNYSSSSIKESDSIGKYLVLQRAEEAWHMYDVQLSNDSIQASLETNLGYHVNHLYPKPEKLNQYEKRTEPNIINEIHLYTTDTSFSYFDTIISIPIGSIYQVTKNSYAKGPSRASIILPAVLIPFGILIVITAIAAKKTYESLDSWHIK
jgi:hypothetical protein